MIVYTAEKPRRNMYEIKIEIQSKLLNYDKTVMKEATTEYKSEIL